MGACFAANYLNMFMGLWEETFVYTSLNQFVSKIVCWGRQVDDILLIMVWLTARTVTLPCISQQH